MAYEYRTPADFLFGSLTNAAAVSDTSLSSADFGTLGSGYSSAVYLPIVLLNPATKTHEKVWLTAHTAGATTATVLRGCEGTQAQAWPAGTQWIVAPTIRDGLMPSSSSALPTDGHVGLRAILNDKGEVWERTYNQGWLGSVKANGLDMGRALDGTASTPNGSVPQLKAWTARQTTDGNGYIIAAIPNGGFPNRVVAAVLSRSTINNWFLPTLNPAQTTKTQLQILASTPSSGPVANTSIDVGIIAVGY